MGTFLEIDSRDENNISNLISKNGLSSLADIEEISSAEIEISDNFYIEVNKDFVEMGDVLTYTVSIKNIEDTPLTNIILTPITSPHLSLVGGSVYVNDVLQGVSDPLFKKGINVGNLNKNGIAKVVFKATVDSTPNNFLVDNSSLVAFNRSNGSYVEQRLNSTNHVISFINKTIISADAQGFVKTVDKSQVSLQGTLLYTITILNKGSVIANNMLLTDNIPKETELIPGSITINSIIQHDYFGSDELVIPIGSLAPNTPYTISYRVRVLNFLGNDEIKSKASLSYNYIIGAKNVLMEKVIDSNEVSTYIKTVDFSGENFVKSCDKSFVDLNEEINYKIKIKNNGNIPAHNAILQDIIPDGTILVENSLTVNKLSVTGGIPRNGLQIDCISPKETVEIAFKAKAISVLNNGLIKSSSNFTYTYNIDNLGTRVNSIVSNEVITQVNTAILDINFDSNKTYCSVFDIINYNLTIKNVGTVAACGVNIFGNLDPSLEYVKDTLFKNGCSKCEEFLNKGTYISDIRVNEVLILTFSAKVLKIPTSGQVTNSANITYSYKIKDFKSEVTKRVNSNQCSVSINDVDFSYGNFVKSCDKDFASIGDIITFTTKIKNTGNIPAKNVFFKDPFDPGCELVEGSFSINGSKAIYDVNLENGVDIGTINPNSEMILTYKFLVNELPIVNPINYRSSISYSFCASPNKISNTSKAFSNYTSIKINSANILLTKDTIADVAVLGQDVVYELIAKNTGNVDAVNVVIKDRLSSFLEFVTGSIRVNDAFLDGNVINGINIGTLKPNESKRIKFTAKVVDHELGVYIVDEATCSYDFILDNKNFLIRKTCKSNDSNLKIEKVDVLVEKETNCEFLTIGESITFTVNITNNSSVPIKNLLFKDVLPDELNYDAHSLKLNNTLLRSGNIRSGIRIGHMDPNEKLTLIYSASLDQIIRSNTLTSEAYGEFCYEVFNYLTCKDVKTNINKTSITVVNRVLHPMNIDSVFKMPIPNGYKFNVNNVRAFIDIKESTLVKPTDLKFSDFSSKEDKVLIVGDLMQHIDYLSADDVSLEKSISFEKRFRTFVNVPKIYRHIKNIRVKPEVEDICFSVTDNNKVFTNIIFTLEINIQ